MSIISILLGILIFGLIIVIHELGHFILAKMNGVTVTEFAVGMGPKLFSITRGGTAYSLRLLPIGGACMMLGEDEDREEPGAFNNKNVWSRISVVVAGPVFNFLLAFLLALIVMCAVGYDPAIVDTVEPGSPMEEAGVQAGDIITRFDGAKISFSRELNSDLTFKPLDGDPVEITLRRGEETYTVTVTPAQDPETGAYLLGFRYYVNVRQKTSPLASMGYAVKEVGYWIESTVRSIGMIFRGRVSKDDISGPLGIVSMIGETYEASRQDGALMVFLNMCNIGILLSANLGVMNLLPIPALDGGRLMFLLLEVIRGKPIDQKKEGFVHAVGFALLLALMAFIFINDVVKLF